MSEQAQESAEVTDAQRQDADTGDQSDPRSATSGVDTLGNEVVPDPTQALDDEGNLVLDASHPNNVAPQEGRMPGQGAPVHAPSTAEGNNPTPEQGGYPVTSPAFQDHVDGAGTPRGPQVVGLGEPPDTTSADREDN